MKRIFGASKPAVPAPTLEEATQKLDTRVSTLDEKIHKLDAELVGIREKLNKTRPGTGPNNLLKQKALKILKQKKMYENQRDQMMNQSFNMEQASFTTQSIKDTITTVSAMKTANQEMKKQFKQIKIDDIDNLQDDMSDLYEMHNEVQEALGRSYSVGEIDESELEDELAALGEELDFDTAPSYLMDNTSSVPTTDPEQVSMTDPVPVTTTNLQ